MGAVSARKLGYRNVYVMPAGIRGWKKAGLAVDKAGANGGDKAGDKAGSPG